jgi:hypothetical protein
MRPSPIVTLLLGLAATVVHGQQATARIVQPAAKKAGITKWVGFHTFRHYAVFRTMPNVICAMVAHASESAGSPFSGSAVFGIVRHASQALEEAKQLIVRSVRSSPSFDGGSLRKHLLFQGEVGV